MRGFCYALLVIPVLFGLQGTAKSWADPDPAVVLILGTFHMGASGDVFNPTVSDIQGERRQAEIEAVVDALMAFEPTRVALEASPDSSRLQEDYELYRSGELVPGDDERYQIGFRIARQMGHDRVFGVDEFDAIDITGLMSWAQSHDQAHLAAELLTGYGAVVSQWSPAFMEETSLLGILRSMNAPSLDASIHRTFVSAMRIGSAEEPVGADLLVQWYARNIRIAANVARIAEPGERVLVLFGANHRRLLIDTLENTAGVDVVQADAYLREPEGEE